MQTLSLWIGVMGLLVSPMAVHAEEIAPMIPLINPPVAPEVLIEFHAALAEGLISSGMKIIPSSTVRSRLNRQTRCADKTCLKAAQDHLGTNLFATVNIQVVGKNYSIEAQLFQETKLRASANTRCDICTLSEAIQSTKKAAVDLGANYAAVVAKATASVSGATKLKPSLQKGNQPALKTPSPAANKPLVTSPPTKLPVEQKKQHAIKNKAQVEPSPLAPTGSTPSLGASSPPSPATPYPDSSTPAGPAPRSGSRVWPLWPGLVAGSVGILGLAVGIPLIVINDMGTQCVGEARPDKSNCAELYKTATGGWALTAVGITGLAAAAVFIPLYVSTKPQAQAKFKITQFSLIPTVKGGGGLGISGQF